MAVENILDLLIQVREINESLFHQADTYLGDTATLNLTEHGCTRVPSIAFDVPPLEQISKLLINHGATSSVANELASIHIERTSELADRYSAIYQATCSDLGQVRRPASLKTASWLFERVGRLTETFAYTVARWEEELLSIVRQRFARRMDRPKPCSATSRAFNHDYVTKLESYFERNRFPSRADRIFLAKESGMSIRQINVWFQNRRARVQKSDAKTEETSNLDCRRKVATPNTTAVLRKARGKREQGRRSLQGSKASLPKSCSRSSSSTLVQNDHPFQGKPPAHAFPTIYPPDLEFNPFPCRSGDFTFPTSCWPRPSSTMRTSGGEVCMDMDILISRFAEMRISDDDAACTTHPASPYPHQTRYVSAADMRTHSYSAPLPAFVPPLLPHTMELGNPRSSFGSTQLAVPGTDISYSLTVGVEQADCSMKISDAKLHTNPSSLLSIPKADAPSSQVLEDIYLCSAPSIGVSNHLLHHSPSSSVTSMPSLSSSSRSPSPISSGAPSPSSTSYSLPENLLDGQEIKFATPTLDFGFNDFFGLPDCTSYLLRLDVVEFPDVSL